MSPKYGKDSHSAPPTRSALLAYGFVRWVVEIFSRLFWRLSVRGKEHIPRTGSFILAPVHRSNIDTVIVAAVTRRRMRYMGKDTMWKYRWSAWFFSAMGGFPVHRETADREALNISLDVARSGEPLVMFPEGTRRSGPVIEPEHMHDGPAYVAAKAGIPVVPVGIGGSEGAMPKGARMIRPVKLTIEVGEPIPPPDPSEGGRVSRKAVRALTETLRHRNQELFDVAQARAGHRASPPVAPGRD